MGSVSSSPLNNNSSVRLRINVHKLSQLIEAGSLCATDFSCPDRQSKTMIEKLFLRCCLHGFQVDQVAHSRRSQPMTDPSN